MKLRFLLILSAAALLLASCGNKGGRTGLLVPKDASFVVHVNSKSLSSKLSWEEIQQSDWFKQMSKEATDSLAQQLLKDPSSSGVDTKGDFVLYTKRQGRGGIIVFEGSLTDAAAFEKTIMQSMKDNPKQVMKDGDFSYILPNDNGAVVWNKSMFAFTGNAPMPDMKEIFEGHHGNDRGYEFLPDSLRIFGKQALTLKSEDNLDKDSRFAELVQNGSDVHLWFNAEGFYNGMGGLLDMMKVSVLFQDNVSAASFNFDDGKISLKSKTYYGEEMGKLISAHTPKPISADIINRIPSSDVVGMLVFNYPPDGLMPFFKMIGVDGMVNGFLREKINYSIEEFVKANKGDVLLSVSDLKMIKKQDTMRFSEGAEPYIYTSTKPDMHVLFATSVNDKAAFEKLITLAWESTKDMKSKDMPEITYKLDNGWFAASNSADQTAKFLAGGNNKLPFTDKISGHPVGFYLDLQKIMKSTLGETVTDSSSKATLDASLNMWQDIVASGGDYKDKAVTFELNINLVDKNTNSLKQLNNYFNKMSSISEARRQRFVMNVDTTASAPLVVPAP